MCTAVVSYLMGNLLGLEEFGKEVAFDYTNPRDVWLIEITGGQFTITS